MAAAAAPAVTAAVERTGGLARPSTVLALWLLLLLLPMNFPARMPLPTSPAANTAQQRHLPVLAWTPVIATLLLS